MEIATQLFKEYEIVYDQYLDVLEEAKECILRCDELDADCHQSKIFPRRKLIFRILEILTLNCRQADTHSSTRGPSSDT